jgi:hypothetical protein
MLPTKRRGIYAYSKPRGATLGHHLSRIRQSPHSRETVSLLRVSYLKAATFRVPLSEVFSCRRRREDDRSTVELSGAPVFTSGAPVFTSGGPVVSSGSTGSSFRLLLLLLLTGSALLRLGTGWSKLYKKGVQMMLVKVAKMEYKNMYRTYCDLNDQLSEGSAVPIFLSPYIYLSMKKLLQLPGREIQRIFLQNDERMNHEAFRKLCRCLVLLLSIMHENILSYRNKINYLFLVFLIN